MNSSSPIESSTPRFGGFALTFGISMAVLSAIAIAILAYYFCTRKPLPASHSNHDGSLSIDDQDSIVIEIGLDEATLNTYPKLLYSEAKEKLEKGDDSVAASCCSICLADYKDSDLLRLLPDCDHLFHAQCIDPWLKLHTTCPMCRNSPVRIPSNVTETASREPRRVFFDPWASYMHFFWIRVNPTPWKAYFVGPGERVKPWLFQALTRGARPDSNSRPAVQISSHGKQDPSRLTPSNEGSSITDQGSVAINLGLDEATLASYPKLLFSQEKSQQKVNHSLDSCCSICLGDYIDSDVLRLLPHCGHTFHLNRVDCWLRLNHTCPICRNLPVPTFSIPLAEVAPLATYRY